MKKIFTFILALTVSVGTLFAESGTCGADGDNLTWDLTDGVLTISGTGEMADYSGDDDTQWYSYRTSIKSAVIEEGVTSIGVGAFYQCTALIAVTIPKSVTSIGAWAFYGCSALSSVAIPNGITTIQKSTFSTCSSLTSVTIPNSVTSIEAQAFYGAGLTSVTFPDGLTSIEDYAFTDCSGLTSIEIPSGLTSIGSAVFMDCSSLTKIDVAPDNPNYSSADGVLFNKDKTFLIQHPIGNPRTEYIIPNNVATIGNYAFLDCTALTSISIPESVTAIGNSAFRGCIGLTSITCYAITPPHCYYGCFIDVNSSIPVYVPEGSVEDYKKADEWKEFTNIQEQECKPVSGTCGAEGDNLTWTLTCDGVLTISGTGDMADWNTDYPAWSPYISTIKSIVIEEGIISIGAWAFYNCSNLTTVTIPNSVTIIVTGAFYNCSNLTTVTIPNSVVYIVGAAFAGCSALSTITIPNSVLYIGDIAFQSCTGLTSITCKATTPPSCGTDCFKNVDKSIPLYVPQGTKAAYKDANEWKEFNNILDELPCEPIVGTCGADGDNLTWALSCEGVLTISGTGDMKDFSSEDPSWAPYISSIQSVVIEEGVENIGMYAFWQCSALTAVTIPNSVTIIGTGAFYNCSNLTTVTIPNSVVYIVGAAFAGCSALSTITIPNSVLYIGDIAFQSCTGLTSITCKATTPPSCGTDCFKNVDKSIPLYVPQGTKEAYKEADEWKEFSNIMDELPCEPIVGTCGAEGDNLTWALSCDGVLTISGTGAMADYESSSDVPWIDYRSDIQSLVIEEGVTSIGTGAFYDCRALTSIAISNSVTSIGFQAFDECIGLSSVTIPNSVKSIGDYAFIVCESLTSVKIGNGVTSIGESAFQQCTSLSSVTLGNSLKTIGTSAFADCSALTSIVIPNSVTSIGQTAFHDCTGLTSIVIPNSVTSIEYAAFYGCSGLTSLTIGKSVTSIGMYAFKNCSALTEITCKAMTPPECHSDCFEGVDKEIPLYVPEGTKEAYKGADEWKDFTNIQEELPCEPIVGTCGAEGDNLTWTLTCDGELIISGTGAMTNWDDAFTIPWYSNRMSIQSVVINDGVTSIGEMAFINCAALSAVTIGSGVTSIGSGAFAYCSGLTEITCKAMTPPTCAASECFLNVDKTIPVYAPTKALTDYQNAYVWKEFTNIQSDECLLGFGTCGAEGDNLTWALSCEGVLTISGTGAMADYSSDNIPWKSNLSDIKSAVIENGATSIGNNAFYNCGSLTSVTISNTVTSIGNNAFRGCSSLSSVTLPEGITSIKLRTFQDCSSLTSITIPAGVTSIVDRAFYKCSGLTSITCKATIPPTCGNSDCFYRVDKTIPLNVPAGTGVDYLKTKVWNEFTNIKDASLLALGTCGAEGNNLIWTLTNEGVLTISGTGEMANWDGGNNPSWTPYLASIKSVVVDDGVTTIGKYAFLGCTSLKSVTIGEDVISIGSAAFDGCTGLSSLTLGSNVQSILNHAFYGCTGLTSLTIPASVTSIGVAAFYGCSGLTEITSEATTPPTCGNGSFDGVNKSIPLYVPKGTKAAYQGAEVWKEFNIQEPFDPTGTVAYELVDLSTEAVTAGQYLIVFDDNKAHAAVSGKDLIASSDELTIENDIAYVPEETVCAVTIAPFGTDSFSILLADGKTYMDLQAKNSVTTSEAASGFAITDGGDKQVQIAKFLPSENKTFVLQHNNTNSGYFRMYSSTNYILPKLYRKVAPVTYHIRFLNDDGTVLQESDIESGATPVYEGATPVKDATAQYTYTFTGWDKPIVAASEDIDYTAVFESTLRSYTVTWINGDGTTLVEESYNYGATPIYRGSEPTRPATAQYEYTFKGWTPEVVAVSKDAAYTAVFEQTLRSYTITFVVGPINYPITVEYGTPMNALMTGLWTEAQAEYGFTQDIEGNYQYSDGINIYTFTGWDKEIPETVTGPDTYTATYTVTPVQPTDINQMINGKCENVKILRDGQLYILRDGILYNAQGARVE